MGGVIVEIVLLGVIEAELRWGCNSLVLSQAEPLYRFQTHTCLEDARVSIALLVVSRSTVPPIGFVRSVYIQVLYTGHFEPLNLYFTRVMTSRKRKKLMMTYISELLLASCQDP